MKLYELANEIVAVKERLDNVIDATGDSPINQDHQTALTLYLEELNLSADEKYENCLKWLRNEEAEAQAIDVEIGRLTARKRARENCIKRLREYMAWSMDVTHTPKVNLPVGTISLSWTKEGIESVDVEEAEKWPPEVFERCCNWTLYVRKPDLAKIEGYQELAGVKVREPRPFITIR